jgi:uncharacterized membrane protein YcaP (DUF421 family)
MPDAIDTTLGLGADSLNAGQMAVRAVITFAVTLVIIRLGSKRLFGKGTAFDNIVAIMIGSIMSGSITGSTPFFPTLAAGTMLVALHWLLAYLSSRLDWFGPLVKGNPIEIVRDGQVLEDGMKSAKLSRHDLQQGLLEQGYRPDPGNVALARLERDGTISVVPKQGKPSVLDVTVADGVQTVRIALE